MKLQHDDDLDPEYDIDHDPFSSPQPLPTLSSTPTVHPGCCLGLSAPLLAHLHALLPAQPALTLSIGSGYGLLEALLLVPPHSLNIVGVEVQPSPNNYLPAAHHRTVAGTRFLELLAAEAKAWLFVYPRRVGLVDEYLRAYAGEEGLVETAVWVGPTADWEDYRGCFEGWYVRARSMDGVGGRAWEMIAVARKRRGDIPSLVDRV